MLDGVSDLVQLAAANAEANLQPAQRARFRAAALRWGDDAGLRELVATAGAPDVVVMADTVYDSNRGAWGALVETLTAIGSGAVCEAPRVVVWAHASRDDSSRTALEAEILTPLR